MGRDGVSNHQPHHFLLNRLFRRRSKKTSTLRVTRLCAGNSPVTGEFSAQMASNAENVSIWWRHHAFVFNHEIYIYAYASPDPAQFDPSEGAFELKYGSACIIGWWSGLLDSLISTYIVQFMGYVIGRIHYGLKVVFCLRHFTAFHYHHHTRLLMSIDCI